MPPIASSSSSYKNERLYIRRTTQACGKLGSKWELRLQLEDLENLQSLTSKEVSYICASYFRSAAVTII